MAVEDIQFLTFVFLLQLDDHELTVEANPLPVDYSIICASRDDPAVGCGDDRGAEGVREVNPPVDPILPSCGRPVSVVTAGLVVVFDTERTS
jgi:hypothetical protein